MSDTTADWERTLVKTQFYMLVPRDGMDVLSSAMEELCAAVCDLERELEETR